MNKGKGFFTYHAKSSAVLVSLAVHAVLIVVAFSFVAISVIRKNEVGFEAKPVSRPKMNLKTLQVPVNVKSPPQQPKLRKQILVKSRETKLPEIRMPEIVGVKGGLGARSGGFGNGQSLGFTLPEFNILGVKGRGERIFIVLDASEEMLKDNVGGIPAYSIIKSELLRVLESLNSTVVFNIAISDRNNQVLLFENMVPANSESVDKVQDWIRSLNTWDPATNAKKIGYESLGDGGTPIKGPGFHVDPLKGPVSRWAKSAFVAMQQQADVVFLLLRDWNFVGYKGEEAREWTEAERTQWNQDLAQARAMHKAENEKRKTKGIPPRVIGGDDRKLVKTYLPNAKLPPIDQWINFDCRELASALESIRRETGKQETLASSLKSQKNDKFVMNVIQFVPEDGDEDKELKMLASLFRGEYRKIEGLAAIQSLAGSGNSGE